MSHFHGSDGLTVRSVGPEGGIFVYVGFVLLALLIQFGFKGRDAERA